MSGILHLQVLDYKEIGVRFLLYCKRDIHGYKGALPIYSTKCLGDLGGDISSERLIQSKQSGVLGERGEGGVVCKSEFVDRIGLK